MQALRSAGMSRTLRRSTDPLRRAGRAVTSGRGRRGILAYHRIASAPIDPWSLYVSAKNFDGHLAVLRARGGVERLDAILNTSPIARTRARGARFAITFDDGYVDNLLTALPILERHDAPATVFLATGLLDRDAFWWDVLAELVLAADAVPSEILEAAGRLGLCATTADIAANDADAVYTSFYSALVERDLAEITELIGQLVVSLGVQMPVPHGRPMTTDEARQLAVHPLISIGAHTITHPRLTCLNPSKARMEIAQGNARLDELFGRAERVLAYPYGYTNSAVADLAKHSGFTRAVTTEERWLADQENSLLVPRRLPPSPLPA